MKPPFFIIGCVRSGTTMLRDVLRLHPNLAAPEETHFYRWTEPFGTPASFRQLAQNRTLIRHREIDTISKDEFEGLLEGADSRRQLFIRYMDLFIRKTKPQARRWFDKTPQNVYGAAMLAADFPRSRFIHIVRHPLDVVLSLRAGKVMEVSSIVGSSNYWRESVANLSTLKRAFPRRVLEIRYEDFIARPGELTGRLLDFVDEPYDPAFMSQFVAHPRPYDYDALLTGKERTAIRRICGKRALAYGYDI